MTWRTLILIAIMLGAMAAAKARAADCPGNPGAIGMSRVLSVDSRDFPHVGTAQYSNSLPLEDKEVVLTFDDGPLPPYTNRVLEILSEQCVKANYFLVGRMARGYAALVKRIHAEGHTIGTHSENNLLGFDKAPLDTIKNEIEAGIASVGNALGHKAAVAPFFRIPGFLRHQEVEGYLQSRGLTIWSADVVADDWKYITAAEVVKRAMARLDEKGKGILLLHDIQPATALALPELLRQLKAKGYRLVQVVPVRRDAPVPVAENEPAAEVLAKATPAPAPVSSPAPPPAGVPAPPTPGTAVAAAEPVRPRSSLSAEMEAAWAKSTPSVEAQAAAAADQPAIPAEAADSLAKATLAAPPEPPVRPYTSDFKPALSMPTPGKLITDQPGGWPPVVNVPVPKAGGSGASSVANTSRSPDGRFQR